VPLLPPYLVPTPNEDRQYVLRFQWSQTFLPFMTYHCNSYETRQTMSWLQINFTTDSNHMIVKALLATCFMLIFCLNYSSTLKMEATCSSEASDFQLTTRRYIPEDRIIHNHRCENLKSYIWSCFVAWAEPWSRPVVFNLFCSRTPRYNFASTLYPQRCWCIIQVIHSL
jgi:hypothetical protein